MKLCFKILFCFYVVLSFLDASKDSIILDGNVYDEVNGLLSSDGKNGEEVGSDVKLSESGLINLTLAYEELVFKVCSTCAATSKVCFETPETRIQAKLECSDISSYCTFEVRNDDDKIFFGDSPVYKEDFGGSCLYPKIHSGIVKVVGTSNFKSCEPKIVDKMIKLYVSINPSCPITVINAKIHAPPTTTTSPTKMPPSIQSHPKDSAEASSFPDWGYAIIGIALLIVILFIGFVVYYLYRKRQTSKRIPPNVGQKQQKSTKAKDATNETPTKKDDDVEAAKVESKKNQKKEKKTIEPTTTEDNPPPTVTQPDSAPSKQLPPPNPAACYPVVKRLIPRQIKSAKTDSLDETLKKGKSVMMESESVVF